MNGTRTQLTVLQINNIVKESILVKGTVAPVGYEVIDYMLIDGESVYELFELAEAIGISRQEALALNGVYVECIPVMIDNTIYPDSYEDCGLHGCMGWDVEPDYVDPDGIDTASLHDQDFVDECFNWHDDEKDDRSADYDLPF